MSAIQYLGKDAIFITYNGQDEATSLCIVISKELAEDIYSMKTAYDYDVLCRGLKDGWLKMYMSPAILSDTSNKNRLLQGVKILKVTEARPPGFFKLMIVPKRSG